MAWEFAAMAAGSLLSNSQNQSGDKKAGEKNYQAQKEFAQHGVRWKVDDAKAAGIHPLYALGAPTTSFAPSYSGTPSSYGQDISRAIDATSTRSERAQNKQMVSNQPSAKMQAQSDRLTLDNMALQNELLRSQIARTQADQSGPAFPSSTPQMGSLAGQANVPSERVVPVPAMPVLDSPYNAGTEAGRITDRSFATTHRGGLVPVPSSDVKQRIEDSLPLELEWYWRNRGPTANQVASPPNRREFPTRPGNDWYWDTMSQQYVQAPKRRHRSGGRTWHQSGYPYRGMR